MFCFSCCEKESYDGMFDFVIYESDSNNYDLSDNPCVSKFHIVYDNCESVTDALIKTGNRYYFDSSKVDYLVLEDGPFGLTYKSGYFSNYKPCSSGEIDVSWSMIFVDKELASSGIGNISLGNIQEVGFVIDGWKDKDFS